MSNFRCSLTELSYNVFLFRQEVAPAIFSKALSKPPTLRMYENIYTDLTEQSNNQVKNSHASR